ncbi:hypothetical protein DSECCO2_131740 [anaerobic digester metagenome]
MTEKVHVKNNFCGQIGAFRYFIFESDPQRLAKKGRRLGRSSSFHLLKLPPLNPHTTCGHKLLNGARHVVHGHVELHQQQVFVSFGDGPGLQLNLAADPALEVQRDVSPSVRFNRHLGICAQGCEVG